MDIMSLLTALIVPLMFIVAFIALNIYATKLIWSRKLPSGTQSIIQTLIVWLFPGAAIIPVFLITDLPPASTVTRDSF